MRLFDGGRAPNPRRVQIFLKEKGIEIERVQIDINALEPKSEAFRAINPMQALPVLQLDDGSYLSETIAICRYFEETVPEPCLFGRTALEKARIEMWQRRMELNFLLPVAFSFRHLHPGAKVIEPVQVEQWGKLNQERSLKFMELFNNEMGKREYVAGDTFSVADITAFVACQFLKPARLAIPEDHNHLQAWFARMSARPSTAFD